MHVKVLSCPNCGGGLTSDCTRCEYCGAGVALAADERSFEVLGVICKKCDARNNATDRYCGTCGSVLLIPCPLPECRNWNSVWRHYCAKCGSDIQAVLKAELDARHQNLLAQLHGHQNELAFLEKRLKSNHLRQKSVRVAIIAIGVVLVAVFVLAHWWLPAFIVVVLCLFFSKTVALTGERQVLLESLEMHKADMSRIAVELGAIQRRQQDESGD